MIRQMKEIDNNLTVILTTAYSDTNYFIEAIELGVEHYLLKPLNIDDVFIKIEKAYKNKYQEHILNHSAKISLIGEMLQNIGHHWRQPLSVISTSASGMKFKKELGELDDEEFNRSIDTIVNNSEYLSKTLLELSSFIKSDEKKVNIKLHKLIEDVVNKIDYKLVSEDVHLILDIDNSIELKTYIHILSQVFLEILKNSIEAFIQNGIEKRYIFFQVKFINEEIVINIKDNAGGVSEQIINKIYEPYFTTKHKAQGIGLSLYLAHRLIKDSLGGSICHENRVFEYENYTFKGLEFKIII